jgi:hypothetical protein
LADQEEQLEKVIKVLEEIKALQKESFTDMYRELRDIKVSMHKMIK